jgi:hypothetical protein
MTSPSPRKHQTIPRSGRASEAPALWLAVAFVAGLLSAAWLPASCPAGGWQAFVRSPEEALRIPDRDAAVSAAGGSEEVTAGLCLTCAAEAAGDEATAKGPCVEEAKDCREKLDQLFDDRLAAIDLDIRVGGRAGNDYPCECRLEGDEFEPRRFASTTFTWKAAGNCHKPLYFEDWQLERYGHSHGPLADPFFSAAHFFVTLPVLPYKMGVELPWECVYPLGYYRPGDCAPWMVPAVPISLRGFAVEAATITGIVFLVP